MKKIAIVGAGGFGKEVAFLLERIGTWEVIGFFDDTKATDDVYGYKVLGTVATLSEYHDELYVVCAIANSVARKRIIANLTKNPQLSFPTLIDPAVIYGKDIKFGKGNVLCAGAILTVDIELADFNIIDVSSTIGHDVVMGSFNTIYPSVSISGCIRTGDCVEFGTGSRVIQNLSIGENAIIGAGSVVVRDIPANTLSVGIPSKVIKQRERIE